MRVKSWYMEWMWRNVPSEILELILSFLPVPALCRFRIVSKAWNHLIAQPAFASLCAKASAHKSYALITPRRVTDDAELAWNLLDIGNEKFYTLSDYFLLEHMENMDRFRFHQYHKRTLAADGGLFCVQYTTLDSSGQAIFVCNPVTKSFKELPSLGFDPCEDGNRPVIVMSVDQRTRSYKIIAIEELVFEESGPTSTTKDRMYVYESRTAQWKKLCIPHENLSPISSVIMDDLLYIVFHDYVLDEGCDRLMVYDTAKDAWSNIDFKLPEEVHRPHLAVCAGRLLFGCGSTISYWHRFLTVWEVLLVENECTLVAHIAGALYDELFPEDLVEGWRRNLMAIDGESNVAAIGCDDSILISSWSGHSVAYDLSKKSWYRLPDNELVKISDYSEDRDGLYGNLITLSLSMAL